MTVKAKNDREITRRNVVMTAVSAAALAGLAGGVGSRAAAAAAGSRNRAQSRQSFAYSQAPSDLTEPSPGIVMFPDYARTIAQTAYVWGWPIINMINRRAAITQAPEPGHLNGVLPAAPRGQIAMLDAASDDPELKKVLVSTAVETEEKVIHPFF